MCVDLVLVRVCMCVFGLAPLLKAVFSIFDLLLLAHGISNINWNVLFVFK